MQTLNVSKTNTLGLQAGWAAMTDNSSLQVEISECLTVGWLPMVFGAVLHGLCELWLFTKHHHQVKISVCLIP